MKSVKQLLDTKKRDIFWVSADTSVYDSLKIMTDRNISALLIMHDQALIGIFTERDYARKIILQGKSSKETAIKEVMTPNPITIGLNDSIDFCMQIMTDKHIRHLPIADQDQIIGMLSIGDVVKFIIADQKETISHLQNYINT